MLKFFSIPVYPPWHCLIFKNFLLSFWCVRVFARQMPFYTLLKPFFFFKIFCFFMFSNFYSFTIFLVFSQKKSQIRWKHIFKKYYHLIRCVQKIATLVISKWLKFFQKIHLFFQEYPKFCTF